RSPSRPTHSFFLIIRPPPRSPLFPYTTLFRSSLIESARKEIGSTSDPARVEELRIRYLGKKGELPSILSGMGKLPPEQRRMLGRSEEHTSELQSLTNLVCRLLLEKKNTYTNIM